MNILATRRERVVLDLEDNLSAKMAKAAASAALLNKELNSLSGSAVRGASRDIEQVGRSSESSGKQIDKLSGRLALFAQAAAALGPALAPIGAAVVPAIAGMTLQLGLAAGAAGVTVLAFQGVGDGLKALNAYQLEPSAANFAKLSEAMDKLGPAGGEFVLALDKMTPKFKELQNLAAQGVLPGATEGLNELMAVMPQAKAVVSTFASTVGDLMASAGDNLNDPAWVAFFDYINVTARPVLTEMGQTLGNFVEGLANMVMAFDPLSRSFSTGFADMAKSFNEWSQNLSGSQGFQEFVDYVQKSGPLAMDALGSIANAIIQLVEAAAPVGSAVLPVITALADGFSAIADSSVGPALIATAAAVSVLSRSMALLGVNAKGLTGGGIASMIGGEQIKAALPTLGQAGTVFAKLGQSAELASEKTLKARAAMSGFRSAIGPSAGLVGGLALATSGLAEKTSLANTMSLGLMGTIAGPWGAAIGGGVGLVMDMAAANDDLVTATKAANRALTDGPLDVANLSTKVRDLNDANKAYWDTSIHSVQDFASVGIKGWTEMFTNAGDEGRDAARKAGDGFANLEDNLKTLSFRMNGGDWSKFNLNLGQMQALATKLAPALQDAGISADSFTKGLLTADEMDRVQQAWHNYVSGLDSAEGKSKSVAAALAELGNEMESNVTQADALKGAMDSLFGVQMDQSAATDAWTQGLRTLREEIGKTNGEIDGNSEAALKNRATIRGGVDELQAKVGADAAAGVSGAKLLDSLVKGRQAIIDQAAAAGASRPKVAAYLKDLGMAPKNLETIITTPGLLNAKQQTAALIKLYGLTPKQVKTLVSESGANPSRAKVEALARALNLTPKQIRTILAALDQATPVIGRVKLGIASIQGKTVTITTVHRDVRVGAVGSGIAANPTLNADGGSVPKTGLPYADRHPYLLADGEEVISNRFGQADRHRALLKEINANRLADGGTAESGKPDARAKHRRDSLGQFDLVGGMSIKELRDEFRGLREDFHSGRGAFRGLQHQAERVSLAYLKHSKALEASKQVLQGLRSDKAQYASTVTGAFTHDPFGNGIAGLKLQLEADRNDARAARGFSKTLDGKRVNQGLQKALLASGDLNTLSQLAALSKADLGQYNTLYQQTASATGGLGRYAAGDQFNAAIAKAGATNARLVKAMAANTAAINKIEHRVEAGTRSGAEAGTRRGMADRAKETTQRRKVKR